jgi:hypothetical protein
MLVCLLVFGLIGCDRMGSVGNNDNTVAQNNTQKNVERWEYNIVTYQNLEQINQLGGEGWELVQIIELKPGGINVTGYRFYFKRRLP